MLYKSLERIREKSVESRENEEPHIDQHLNQRQKREWILL